MKSVPVAIVEMEKAIAFARHAAYLSEEKTQNIMNAIRCLNNAKEIMSQELGQWPMPY